MNLKDFEDIQAQLPATFAQWVRTKDLGTNELKIVAYAISKLPKTTIDNFLEYFVTLSPTRQTGNRILEYYFELVLSGLDISLDGVTHADQLLDLLYKKRFPLTSKSDTDYENRVKVFPWPAHVKARWLRQGDRAGVEIKIFATSADELKKKISALNEIKDKSEKEIW